MIGIDDDAPTPIPKRSRAIRFAKYILRRQLPRAHFFVAPKNVTLRMAALGQQAICQPNGLDGFAVVNGFDFDAGLLLEPAENRLGIHLVLRGVNNNRPGRSLS